MKNRQVRRSYLARLGFGFACASFSWLLTASPAAFADAEWTQTYDKDGIQVATRPVEGSSIHAFRAEVEVDASIDSLLAVLADPDACARWIHNCKMAKVLASTGFYQRDTYQINDMPWPVQDRDLALEVRIHELANGSFRLDMINQPESVPEGELVRIRQYEGFYLLTPLESGGTRIEWEQHTDPGGSLPAWLINQLLVDVPVNTLKQLREIANEEPYRDQVLKRNRNGEILGWRPRGGELQQVSAL